MEHIKDSLQERVSELEQELIKMQQRNIRVERDKAWEQSPTRIFLLLVLTYAITSVVFFLIYVPHPFLNAIIPTLGYLISTQSLSLVKKWWLNKSFGDLD